MNMKAGYAGPLLLLLGIIAWVLFPLLPFAEPIFSFKLGFGTVVLLAAMVIALVIELQSFCLKLSEHRYQQRLEEHWHQQTHAHRQFIRRLDHEIKNPLTTLGVELENLLATNDDAAQERAASNARTSLDRLGRLLSDLRKISELEETLSETEPIDITQILADTVQAARASRIYQNRNIRLLIPEIPSSMPPVLGDSDLLQLAFHNLLDNALKFSSQDDTVEIRVSDNEECISIQFADSGLGVPPDEQELIFMDLYRGSNVSQQAGSGLGLSLVQRIARLHGGQIHLRNLRGGEGGTIFTIELPVGV